jgi:hypothetical protein
VFVLFASQEGLSSMEMLFSSTELVFSTEGTNTFFAQITEILDFEDRPEF